MFELYVFLFQRTILSVDLWGAISSPVSPLICNLYMEYIENKDTSTAAHPPAWWLRYVDDTHLKHKKDLLESFNTSIPTKER